MTKEEATALVYGNPEGAIELILEHVGTVERLIPSCVQKGITLVFVYFDIPNTLSLFDRNLV